MVKITENVGNHPSLYRFPFYFPRGDFFLLLLILIKRHKVVFICFLDKLY